MSQKRHSQSTNFAPSLMKNENLKLCKMQVSDSMEVRFFVSSGRVGPIEIIKMKKNAKLTEK